MGHMSMCIFVLTLKIWIIPRLPEATIVMFCPALGGSGVILTVVIVRWSEALPTSE